MGGTTPLCWWPREGWKGSVGWGVPMLLMAFMAFMALMALLVGEVGGVEGYSRRMLTQAQTSGAARRALLPVAEAEDQTRAPAQAHTPA